MMSGAEAILSVMPDRQRDFAYALRGKIKRHKPIDILLVEDDPSDVMLAECALTETYIRYRLHTVQSGADVLPYLRREPPFSEAVTPDVILLDLSLPHKDGFAVLAELTQAALTAGIPIIILTGSESDRYVLKAYDLWLSDYVAKPCSSEKLLESFGKLHSPG